jgi:diphthamide synthase subunit DPH2
MKHSGKIQEKAILYGWVVLILFLMSLLWAVTTGAQKHNLLRSVNSVLVASGETKRISDYSGPHIGKAGLLGYWYSIINSQDKMFVFTVFQDGILIPLGASVTAAGSVYEIIPLGAHAVQVMEKMPESILKIYITRIEAAYLAASMEGSK